MRCGVEELCAAAFDSRQDAIELPHDLPGLIAQALARGGPELEDGVSPQQELAQLVLLAGGRLIGVQVSRFCRDEAGDQGGNGSIGLAALANRLGVLMNPARVHHENGVTVLDELAGEQLVQLARGLHTHQAASRQLSCKAINRPGAVVQAKRRLLLGTNPLNVNPPLADVASHDDSHLASLGFTLEVLGWPAASLPCINRRSTRSRVSPLDSNRRCRKEWGEISRSLYSQESDRRTPPSTPALANYRDSPGGGNIQGARHCRSIERRCRQLERYGLQRPPSRFQERSRRLELHPELDGWLSSGNLAQRVLPRLQAQLLLVHVAPDPIQRPVLALAPAPPAHQLAPPALH